MKIQESTKEKLKYKGSIASKCKVFVINMVCIATNYYTMICLHSPLVYMNNSISFATFEEPVDGDEELEYLNNRLREEPYFRDKKV